MKVADIGLTKKQELVVNTRGKTILVSASAGSGKTFVVIERIIKRIIEDKIDLDKILVVTFTNAAASELKERLVKKLHEKLKENLGNKELETYIYKQIRLASKANISTIHSFCLSVIRSSFYYLEIEPTLKTLEQTKASVMILEILENILDTQYEKKEEVFADCLELFGCEENLVETILDLYYFAKNIENYEEWLNDKRNLYSIEYSDSMDLMNTSFGVDIVKNAKASFKLIKNNLEDICFKLSGMPKLSKRLDILEALLEKVERASTLEKYDEIYSYLPVLLDNRNFSGLRNGSQDLRDESSRVMKETVEELKKINSIIYKDTKGIIEDLNSMIPIIDFLINIVKTLDKEYMTEKTKKGYLDFNDYEHLALKALNNEEIRKEYIDKFEEIYIDEYQDTSSIQEQVISKISKSNNVVMVGDLKQSIYSFRNAEPGLLGDKYEKYEDILDQDIDVSGEDDIKNGKVVLSTNFRSRKEILDSTNYIFSRIMSKQYGGIDYTDKESLIYSGIYDDNIYKTEINIVDVKEYEIEESNEAELDMQDGEILNNVVEEKILNKKDKTNIELEAKEIGNRINQFINSGFKIYDLKTKSYRACEYRDIVILMRAPSSKSEVISRVLQGMNIPLFSDNSEGFYDSEEVGLVISFLKVLNNHLDDISLASIMYSIIGKFTLDEMVFIKRNERDGYLYNSLIKCREKLDNQETESNLELKDKIDVFLNYINKFRNYVKIYSVSETIEKVYTDTGIYYSFYLEENGENKCMKLDTLVELAKNFEREEKAVLASFIGYIENIKRRGDKGESSPKILGENENVVRLMTIHKSKGLEFPIVILCDSNKENDIRDTKSIFVLNKEVGIGINIYDKDFGISYPSIIKQNIKEKIREKVISEELRLLYVAMTRAKEKLCIFGVVKDADSFIEKMNKQGSSVKVDKEYVKVANSYLKSIIMAISYGYVNKESEFLNNFEVNIISTNKTDQNIEINDDVESYKESTIDRSISLKDKFLKIASERKVENICEEDIESFKQKICKEYKYVESNKIKKKYTVTELKKIGENKYDIELNTNTLSKNNNNIPKVLEASIDSMSYGTIIHKIVEKVDLKNRDVTKREIENISRLVVSKYDNFEEKDLIKVTNMVYEFLNSEIREYLDNAKEIKKEVEYVSFDKLSQIEELKKSESTLIQGIVDLYIETFDGKRIVIDFKTDKVKLEKDLIDRYKYQLLIYKYGLENVLNKKIDMLYIYSFELKKLVLIL